MPPGVSLVRDSKFAILVANGKNSIVLLNLKVNVYIDWEILVLQYQGNVC